MIQADLVNHTPTNFEAVLAERRAAVWPVVQAYLRDEWAPLIRATARTHPEIAELHEALVSEYPNRRGKYLRPTLLLLTCEALGKDPGAALNTAAAMQLSEDWLLIHDDWEDGSTHRRGAPALHCTYGPELAVNGGDALHMLMWHVLDRNHDLLPRSVASRVSRELFEMLTRTALGQTIEIEWTRSNRVDLSEDDWYFVADGKTAYYSIAGPMRLGAIIGGATDQQLDDLMAFGRLLGRAFQITDDVLDLTSDFNGLKAQLGNDVYEGKRTLILIRLLAALSPNARDRLVRILRTPRHAKRNDDVRWVIGQAHEHGCIASARATAADLAQAASRLFERELTFLSREPARTHLAAAIPFLHQRRS